MEIVKIQALRNSNNCYSNAMNFLEMTLKLEKSAKMTNQIEGFSNRIKTILPGLYLHKYHDENVGAIFRKLESGMPISELICCIAVELQILAGMKVHFIKNSTSNETGMNILTIPYIDEHAGTCAALAAVEIVENLLAGKPYFVKYDIQRLKEVYAENQLKQNNLPNINYFKISPQKNAQFEYRAVKQNVPNSSQVQQAT
ncbi:hypothetical protein MG290_03500 [Flavobacterium sp. CBA20B-1]|uniref:cyanophycin synthetase family protein n=1 Tax=unclassified Flavobacterium TaxID=196869 RepID=UPI002225950D|nr:MULTISPECIES: hypothetical protein [unclassified Flavobacterium]WCM42758.1 hypothetical protein MG290_03500 [Flavobacterium sp. CBA20B-1]